MKTLILLLIICLTFTKAKDQAQTHTLKAALLFKNTNEITHLDNPNQEEKSNAKTPSLDHEIAENHNEHHDALKTISKEIDNGVHKNAGQKITDSDRVSDSNGPAVKESNKKSVGDMRQNKSPYISGIDSYKIKGYKEPKKDKTMRHHQAPFKAGRNGPYMSVLDKIDDYKKPGRLAKKAPFKAGRNGPYMSVLDKIDDYKKPGRLAKKAPFKAGRNGPYMSVLDKIDDYKKPGRFANKAPFKAGRNGPYMSVLDKIDDYKKPSKFRFHGKNHHKDLPWEPRNGPYMSNFDTGSALQTKDLHNLPMVSRSWRKFRFHSKHHHKGKDLPWDGRSGPYLSSFDSGTPIQTRDSHGLPMVGRTWGRFRFMKKRDNSNYYVHGQDDYKKPKKKKPEPSYQELGWQKAENPAYHKNNGPYMSVMDNMRFSKKRDNSNYYVHGQDDYKKPKKKQPEPSYSELGYQKAENPAYHKNNGPYMSVMDNMRFRQIHQKHKMRFHKHSIPPQNFIRNIDYIDLDHLNSKSMLNGKDIVSMRFHSNKRHHKKIPPQNWIRNLDYIDLDHLNSKSMLNGKDIVSNK